MNRRVLAGLPLCWQMRFVLPGYGALLLCRCVQGSRLNSKLFVELAADPKSRLEQNDRTAVQTEQIGSSQKKSSELFAVRDGMMGHVT